MLFRLLPRRLLGACLVALCLMAPAWGATIHLDSASGVEQDGHLMVDARYKVSLDPVHENALLAGVPLDFVMDFTLTRPRWYWAWRRVADWFSPTAQIDFKLYYHELTRTYRVQVGSLFRSYDTLDEALNAIGVVRDWEVGSRGSMSRRLGSGFAGEISLHLDKTQLPKPLQLSLLGDSDWQLDSGTTTVVFEEAK